MRVGIIDTVKSLWTIDKKERLKFFYLALVFFCIIGSYTIIKELKDSIFMDIMGGKSFVPVAKLFTILGFIPLVLLYAKMVDRVRRYQLLCYTTIIYSVIGFISAAVIVNGTVGSHTAVVPYSLYWVFGWIYFFYIESFSPFVVSVFWAFLNSVTTPESAKKNYGPLISASKLGGMLTSGLAWYLLSSNNHQGWLGLSESYIHGLLMLMSSVLLLVVPLTIWHMMRNIPGYYLHGYEAAYQFEKQQHKEGKDETGMWSGLAFLIKFPYVFGIFSTIFFYEIINAVLAYMRLGVAESVSTEISGVSCFLFQGAFYVHMVGLVISLLGTRLLISVLGERLSLFVMPSVIGVLLWYLYHANSVTGILIAFVVLRGVYYAFNQPVIEALYIPTVKDVKFKSKSWIDTFGKKVARGTGSAINILVDGASNSAFGLFLGAMVGMWWLAAYFLGRRFDQAIARSEVIGAENQPQ